MRAISLLILLTMLMLYGPTSRAEDDKMAGDIACLLFGLRISSLSDPKAAQMGYFITYYYLGRVDGRDTNFDFKSYLTKDRLAAVEGNLEKEAVRCGDELNIRREELEDLAAYLVEMGRAERR